MSTGGGKEIVRTKAGSGSSRGGEVFDRTKRVGEGGGEGSGDEEGSGGGVGSGDGEGSGDEEGSGNGAGGYASGQRSFVRFRNAAISALPTPEIVYALSTARRK